MIQFYIHSPAESTAKGSIARSA